MMHPTEIGVLLTKPAMAGAVATILDKIYLHARFKGIPITEMKPSLFFGLATAIGVGISEVVVKMTPVHNVVGKSLEQRVLEIGLASTIAIPVDYRMGNATSESTFTRVAMIAVADYVGEEATKMAFGHL